MTVSTDTTTGVGSNCTAGSTTDASCSLRDALAAVAANSNVTSSNPATISFSPTVFLASNTAAQNTITEINGTLNLPSNTTIQGLTTGSGASLTNLITLNGNAANTVVTNGGNDAAIDNLIITNGSATAIGGGIYNTGSLTLSNSTVMNNSTVFDGGGIGNTGILMVNGCTFNGNTAGQAGGGIFLGGTAATVSNSTFYGNSAVGGGGLYFGQGSATVTNSTFTGNTAVVGGGVSTNQLCLGTGCSLTLSDSIVEANTAKVMGANFLDNGNNDFIDGGGNLYISSDSAAQLALAPLGSYGGPTQTMPVLPGSPAFCTGGGTGADQRGVARPTAYNGTSCTDIGATNSDYTLAWTTQPASTYDVGVPFSPAPVVQFEDDGAALPYPAGVTITDAGSQLGGGASTGTATVALGSSGSLALSTLDIGSPETSDTLTAAYTLSLPSSATASLSAGASNTFAVVSPVAGFLISTLPAPEVAGTPETFTVTALSSLNPATTATGFTGTVTFSCTDNTAVLPASYKFVAGDNGVHTFTNGLTFKITGTQTLTVTSGTVTATTPSITVTAAAATTLTASSGTGQSAAIGAAFASPLTVQAVDSYSNPVPGAVVTFNAPTTGASATLSATTCTTSATSPVGACSVTATANGTASATACAVSATTPGVTTPASFMLTNTQHPTSVQLSISLFGPIYGQPFTLNAGITPSSAGGTAPTGSVTFYDGATNPLTPNSPVANATASYTVSAATPGIHQYYAKYLGDTNFSASSQTALPSSIMIGKASSTLTGPTSTVFIPYGQSGTFNVSLAGQFSGTGIAPPSGSVTASVGNGLNTSLQVTMSNDVATITFPSNGTVQTYPVTVSYAGDGNYAAAQNITVQVQVGQIAQTISFTPVTQVTYGVSPIALTASGGASGNTVVFSVLSGPGVISGSGNTLTVTGAGTIVVAANQTGNTTYSAATQVTASIAVSKATLTATANPATSVYGAAFPTFTGPLTGVVGGDGITASYGTTATPTSPVGGSYTIAATLSDPNSKLGNYTVINVPAVLTITKATPAVTLTSSQDPVLVLNPVILTATFTSSAGAPPNGEGVTFYDSTTSTALGQGAFFNGVAVLSVATLGVGSHSIVATYSGDADFVGASSPPLSETVQDFNITISASGGSASVTNVTALPGGTAVYTFTLSPIGSTTFPADITLSANGLPAGATATFSPAILAAGSGSKNVTMTVHLATASAKLQPGHPFGRGYLPIALGILLLPFSRRLRRVGRKLGRGVSLALLLVGLAAAAGLTGCGFNSGYFGQSQQTYTVTVSGTSGALTRSTTVSLTVE